MRLTIGGHTFDFTPEDTETASAVFANAPIELTLDGVYGGEIYGLTDIDLPLSENAREVFAVGDVVYWRSQKSEKKAIAVFFGEHAERRW